MVEIFKFRIILWQDLKIAKKILPVYIYLGYKAASNGLFNILKTALNTRLKSYNPHTEGKKLVYEQETKTYSESQDEKDNLEGFFFGEDDKFKTKDEVKKILGNHAVTYALTKLKKNITTRFIDGNQLINFFNKMSIYISWDIIELEKK